MFFTCFDAAGVEHHLVFVRWYAEASDCPEVFNDPAYATLYLRWQPAAVGRGAAAAVHPKYSVIPLQRVERLVFIQPDFRKAGHVSEAQHRFFFNRYLRCEP